MIILRAYQYLHANSFGEATRRSNERDGDVVDLWVGLPSSCCRQCVSFVSFQLGIYMFFSEIQVKTLVFVETSGELRAEIVFSIQVVQVILSRMALIFKVYNIGLGIEWLTGIHKTQGWILSITKN